MGLAAPQHVGGLSFPTGIEPMSPCIARWILYYWTTREVPHLFFVVILSPFYSLKLNQKNHLTPN